MTMTIIYGQTLLTGERQALQHYIGLMPDDQRLIYTEAKRLGRASGCLIHAYEALDEFLGWPLGMNEREETRNVEDELICAEEWLDHYAAQLDLEQTHFDCIGDYIKAVVEAFIHQRSTLQAALQHAVTNLRDLQNNWPEHELHEPVRTTLDRAKAAYPDLE